MKNRLKTINEPLSDVPSKAIRQAVADLEAVEASDDYFVDMEFWKNPGEAGCSVCMAGAVMQRRAGDTGFTGHENPQFYLKPNRNQQQCYEIESFNELRNYSIEEFLNCWLIAQYEVDRLIDEVYRKTTYGHETSYQEDPTKFKANMLEIADILEKEGY